MGDPPGRSVTPGAPGDHVHPTLDDPVVASLSEGVGGPVGSRAGRHRWWTPAAVLLVLTGVAMALGMLQKTPCYTDTWSDGQVRYSAMCYSDLPYLYTGRGMVERTWPYSDDEQVRDRFEVMEYPVGISYWAWGTAWVTHALVGMPDLEDRYDRDPGALFGDPAVQREIRGYVIVNALGLALLALLAVWLLARVNPGRPWDAAAVAVSPALVLTGLVNWDLLAVACVAGALWAWSRDRPVLTGVLIGLGTAAKLYPLFLLGGVLVLCARRRRWRELALASAAAAIAWLVTNAPAFLTGRDEWLVFWGFNSDRGADLGSIWLVVSQAADTVIDPSTINDVSAVFFLAWCLGVAVLGWVAPSPPRLAQLGFLVVVGFLLVNKVYSPQYVLWLLPLAALARPRWRDQLVWQGTEVLYVASVWWYLGGYLAPGSGDDAGFYWLAIVVRMLGELYLVVLVVRDVLHPAHDPVPREASWDARPGRPWISPVDRRNQHLSA